MKTQLRMAVQYLTIYLSLAVVLFQAPLSVFAQQQPAPVPQSWTPPGPVDIMIGRPSIWTLAQAHYLLAQMHQQDRALKIKALADLEPNAVNRRRIEVLQTLMGITGEFDQTAGLKNQMLQQRFQSNFNRTQTVQTELDRRNNDLLQVGRELYFIDTELARLRGANPPDQDAIKAKSAERDAKALEKQLVDNRISSLNSELTRLQVENVNTNLPGLTGPFAGPQPTPSPLANRLNNLIDKPFLDNLYKDTANQSSALSASIQLDNHIQMQYELISKQLTLLRDEVGPDEQVIFLELPSGLYSVPKKGDDYIAQVRWEVSEFCRKSSPASTPSPSASPSAYERDVAQLTQQLNLTVEATPTPTPAPTSVGSCWTKATADDVRTVDVIPRQSALNVNSIHQTSKGFALAARFLTVFGFGAKVDYQRQRDVYDQFVYQDIFASGFGKGSNLFGWTFGALPGTKALAPGVRTTFAVLVVPQNTSSIRVKGKGYAFRRSELQPDRDAAPNAEDTFEIQIPRGDVNGFWLERADYSAVKAGDRISLVLRGANFSPQIGILINGLPLERRIALAPIDLPTPSASPSAGGGRPMVTGEYEFVNSTRIVASFTMGGDYEGTPLITLITPEKVSTINNYPIEVNGRRHQTLEQEALLNPMFLSALNISDVLVDKPREDCGNDVVRAVVSGKGFRRNASFSINGTIISNNRPVCSNSNVYPISQKSTHEYELYFKDQKTPSWDLVIRQSTSQGQEEFSKKLDRPLAPRVAYDILEYVPGQSARADLRLTSTGFQKITLVHIIDGGKVSTGIVCPTDPATPPEPIVNEEVVPRRGRSRTKRGPRIPPAPGTCTWISSGEVFVSLRLPPGKSDPSFLLMVRGDKDESMILSVLPPLAPTIGSITNDVTKKAEGALEGGYSVVIRGDNLERVDRVLFGFKPATIQHAARGVLTVLVPRGEEGPVRVVLETNMPYQNRFLSNSQDFADPGNTRAIFTYVKPKPPSS